MTKKHSNNYLILFCRLKQLKANRLPSQFNKDKIYSEIIILVDKAFLWCSKLISLVGYITKGIHFFNFEVFTINLLYSTQMNYTLEK